MNQSPRRLRSLSLQHYCQGARRPYPSHQKKKPQKDVLLYYFAKFFICSFRFFFFYKLKFFLFFRFEVEMEGAGCVVDSPLSPAALTGGTSSLSVRSITRKKKKKENERATVRKTKQLCISSEKSAFSRIFFWLFSSLSWFDSWVCAIAHCFRSITIVIIINVFFFF